MKKNELKDAITQGNVLCRIVLELQVSPKEHVEKTAQLLKQAIQKDFKVLSLSQEPVEELEDQKKIYSTFFEMEILFESISKVFSFCIDYTPSSIEVLEPVSFEFDSNNFSDFLNDTVAKLHHQASFVKQLLAENKKLHYNASAFFRNLIIVTLAQKSRNLDDLCGITGIQKKELEPILKNFIDTKEEVSPGKKITFDKKSKLYSLT